MKSSTDELLPGDLVEVRIDKVPGRVSNVDGDRVTVTMNLTVIADKEKVTLKSRG